MIRDNNEIKKFSFSSKKKNISYEFIAKYVCEFNDNYDGYTYSFDVYEKSKENDSTFSLILLIMKNGIDLKVVDLYPDYHKYYLGKGISVNLILKCREIFGKRIISSNNLQKSQYCEWNSPIAVEKVWKPLVNSGVAVYVEEEDQYVVF